MTTVLVTGAGGGIGRVVVRHLVDRGHRVRALDRAADDRAPAGVEWHTGDLADPAVAAAAVDGVASVVHLAATPSPADVPADPVYVNNVTATYHVLDAAGNAGVRRAVIASSVSVYGIVWARQEIDPPEIPLSETSELRTADPYALSKRADEACAEMAHRRYGVDVLCYRFPDVGDTARLAARAAQVRADPAIAHRELWAYLHVEDAAVAVELGLTARFSGALAVNVVGPGTLGDVDLADLARRFYPAVPCHLPDREGNGRAPAGYTTDRAERLLGFRAARGWHGRPSTEQPSHEEV